MSPVKGVGSNVIRKQLMEETLKVRLRKETKELVVLLFTDVLLMTKTLKKSDKLKVVRPPLPLERIHCIEFKDGYSFVLVEVGDLGCAVSVNFLSTPSPDSCASWVSALRETKAALETLRKNETNKTLKTSTTEFGGSERPNQDELSDKVMEDPDGQSVSDRSDSDIDPAELVRLHPFHTRKSETEMLIDVEQSKVQQLAEDRNSPLIAQQNDQSQSAHEEVAGKTDSAGLQMEEGRNMNYSKQLEEEEAPSQKISERRVTWKHGRRSSANSNDVTQQDLPVRNQSNGSYTLLPGGDVEKNFTSSQSLPITSASNKLPTTALTYGASAETGQPMHLDQEDDSQEIKRNSVDSQSGDDNGLLTESGRFSRKLKSPRIRRRRPNNLQPYLPSDSSRTAVNGLELTSNANSSENQRRASNPCIKPQDSHRVLKLGSLKNNHGTLWNVPEKKLSPDPQTHSEPEQTHDGNVQKKPVKLKTQRSASIPEISSLPPSHRRSPSPPPGLDPQLHPSPLQDLLQRAKERERGLGKREGKKKTLSLQNSPTISASPSPSVSEGEREAEREESAVPRMVSAHGWREGNVDGSEDEMKESNNVLEGISVDWPGWCFDDEEVFDFQNFDDENWFEKKLTTNESQRPETKDETECSEV